MRDAEIPEIIDDDGTRVRVVCGDFWGKRGPVEGVAADPRYLDVWVPPCLRKSLPVETERHAFAYVFEGSGSFLIRRRSIGCPPRINPPGSITLGIVHPPEKQRPWMFNRVARATSSDTAGVTKPTQRAATRA